MFVCLHIPYYCTVLVGVGFGNTLRGNSYINHCICNMSFGYFIIALLHLAVPLPFRGGGGGVVGISSSHLHLCERLLPDGVLFALQYTMLPNDTSVKGFALVRHRSPR